MYCRVAWLRVKRKNVILEVIHRMDAGERAIDVAGLLSLPPDFDA